MGEDHPLLSGLQLDLRMDRKVVLVLLIGFVALSLQQKIPRQFKRYTKSTKGCPCWFDLTKTTECGCCKDNVNAMQCGFPKHKFCFKKTRNGCPGVPGNRFTLSATGYQCFDKKERDLSCAWCVPGRFQCSGKQAGKCGTGNLRQCDSVMSDCKHIPNACDPNASCVPGGKLMGHTLYKCECNDGWTGNGVHCFDADGNMGIDPKEIVSVNMKVASDYYLYPHTPDQYPNGALMDSLISEMTNVNSSCTTNECEVTYSAVNL